MGSDYREGNLHCNDSNCSSCSAVFWGSVGIIRVILCKLLGGCSRIQVVLSQGTLWVWQKPGTSCPVEVGEGWHVPGRAGELSRRSGLISPPAPAAGFLCPNSKADVPLPWAFSTAGSCSRVPLEQLNTTGMALLLLLLPCQDWQQKRQAGSDGRIKTKDYFHL